MSGRRPADGLSGVGKGAGIALAIVAAFGFGAGEIRAQGSGPTTGADFSYLGAFRLDCSGDWCSYNLNDLGAVPGGELWVTDHVYDYAVRRISIPTAPLVSQVFGDLPEAVTVEGPLDTTGCPGDSTDISGVHAIGAEAATTCRDWYNVTGDYTPVFRRRPSAGVHPGSQRADSGVGVGRRQTRI